MKKFVFYLAGRNFLFVLYFMHISLFSLFRPLLQIAAHPTSGIPLFGGPGLIKRKYCCWNAMKFPAFDTRESILISLCALIKMMKRPFSFGQIKRSVWARAGFNFINDALKFQMIINIQRHAEYFSQCDGKDLKAK